MADFNSKFKAATETAKKSRSGSEYDDEIESAKALLRRAAAAKNEDGGAVVDALLSLEKTVRAKARVDESVAEETLLNLDGAWRLVFTTGNILRHHKHF